jgi:hypothetical protein
MIDPRTLASVGVSIVGAGAGGARDARDTTRAVACSIASTRTVMLDEKRGLCSAAHQVRTARGERERRACR